MELKTSIIDISGSFYIRIPPAFVEYYKLKKTNEAKIEDTDKNKLSVTLPVW